MNPLDRFEDMIESAVEGSLGNIAAGHLHPVEIAKRLGRAMDGSRTISAGKTLVANSYVVRLSGSDYAALSSFRQSLEHELEEYLRSLAAERGVSFLIPPHVEIYEDHHLRPRRMSVLPTITDIRPARRDNLAMQITASLPVAEVQAALEPAAQLVLSDRRVIALKAEIITLGRNLDNDIVIEDRRVSRYHAQIRLMHGRFCLFDMQSANHTLVNGAIVDQIVLNDGDRISLGGADITFQIRKPEARRAA
jgi:pSer/pThr/pTyr-binding forkhead associated (FHA) protein